MSEYKFVQWGKGIPVDYQRLGQMVSNEEYLKNKVEYYPRGVLLWKEVTGETFVATGALQDLPSLSNLSFDVDSERLISIEFNAGIVFASAASNLRTGFVIDNNTYNLIGGTNISATNLPEPSTSRLILAEALPRGTHTITVQVRGDTSVSMTLGYDSTRATLIVRDEGPFISAAP